MRVYPVSRGVIALAALAALYTAGLAAAAADAPVSAPPQYAVTRTLKIGGDGGWDYVRLDEDGKLLYLPRSTHTMIVETETGKTVADMPGQKRNHGVALVPQVGRGFISDGEEGAVWVFDAQSNEVLGKVKADQDADGIIYDPASNKVLVVCGDAGSMYEVAPDVDPKSGSADPAIDLGGKPEYLAVDGKGKAFVNLADKNQVAVVDTKTGKVLDHWATGAGTSPTGMSIDAENGRLFVGCRNQKMIVMSTKDGSVLADLPIGRGVDATVFDRGLGFASCADGTLTIVRETEPGAGKFEVAQTVKTGVGARTMAVDPKTGKIYLATADMTPPPAGEQQRGRPKPIPGTFKVLVVEPVKDAK